MSWIRHDTSERETRRLTDMQRLGNLGWASWNLVTDTVTWSDQVSAVFDRDPADGPMALEGGRSWAPPSTPPTGRRPSTWCPVTTRSSTRTGSWRSRARTSPSGSTDWPRQPCGW
ncbi:hypothetical protein ACIBTP_18320 [Streptomyces avidinii]|uniref:hypothetical protein n=1 Tax=Streptomyces avidinii TaxID=1895 RepID=UPI0037A20071